ncbi:NAD(P)-binding protein [Thozetella sp. PMI_491]|nr:NAD(P)-binding protein [Thozetella sp. PMI_491]
MAAIRNILVTGATGKQGMGLIHSLLAADAADYHVLALTRSASSARARLLLEKEREHAGQITLTEGNLDDAAGIRKIFEDADSQGGIWGVFAVLAYPGLGKDAAAEETQGKLLADLGLEFAVSAFIYSSTIPPGVKEDDAQDQSHRAKRNVERYCQDLGTKGLNWIIIRPGFFMENFDGFLGSLAVAIFQQGLTEQTTIALIASEDIGSVGAGVLKNHERYLHKILTLTSGCVTMSEITQSYERAMKKPMPAVPGILGRLLLWMNSATRNMHEIEQHHEARVSGQYSTFTSEVELAQSVSHMQTFFEWKSSHKSVETGQKHWNRVSLFKLITGRA